MRTFLSGVSGFLSYAATGSARSERGPDRTGDQRRRSKAALEYARTGD